MTLRDLVAAEAVDPGQHAYLRVRDAKWANPHAYLRVSVIGASGGSRLGPLVHLFDRLTQEAIGEPTPQITTPALLSLDAEVDAYTGPLDRRD